MADVFVSYSKKDGKELSELVYYRLRKVHLLPWRDEEDIDLGKDWRASIDEKIRDCLCMVVIVTEEALRSQYVNYEWAGVTHRDKTVISLIFKNLGVTIPNHHPIERFQFIEFENENDDKTWEKLFTRIRELRNQESTDRHLIRAEELIHSPLEDERRSANQFLVNHNHPQAMTILANAINDSDSYDVVKFATMSLCAKDPSDDRAIPGFIQVIEKESQHSDLFRRSANSLSTMNNPKAVEALRFVLLNNDLPQSKKREIIKQVHQQRTPSAYDLMVDLITDVYLSDFAILHLTPAIQMYFFNEAMEDWVIFFEMLTSTTKHGRVRVALLELLKKIISEFDELDEHEQFIADILVEAIQQYAGEQYTTANAEPFKALVDTLKALGALGKEKINDLYNNRRLAHLLRSVRA